MVLRVVLLGMCVVYFAIPWAVGVRGWALPAAFALQFSFIVMLLSSSARPEDLG